MNPLLHTVACYHQWAYEILFTAVDQLSKQHYFSEVGLAFSSVHGTLNHLYLGDHLWFCRFNNKQHTFHSVNDISFDTYSEIKQGLQKQAKQWLTFTANLPETLPETITSSNFNGKETVAPYLSILLHVFNHATHHRGQLSAVLTQKGIAAPEMDLYFYLKQLQNQ